MLDIEWFLMALCGGGLLVFAGWIWHTAEAEAALPIEPDARLLDALAQHRGWSAAQAPG